MKPRTASEETLEREFLQVALRRAEFLRLNQPQKANKEYNRLYKFKGLMRQLPDRGEAALKRIAAATTVPDEVIIAAAALLAVDEPFAIGILEGIRDTDPGLPSFTADMTLREWRAGRIREYWS